MSARRRKKPGPPLPGGKQDRARTKGTKPNMHHQDNKTSISSTRTAAELALGVTLILCGAVALPPLAFGLVTA
ncbi:hypothetical protein PBI_JACE_30 [Gordonia phage Jace]|uniref:Uncharacterized protein n=1 Tax=Gordonia phage Jace TaxID=2182360 RepID=A0A2U8UJ57_9CAUD|nr:hypothetical protein HOT28_gp30 [Gordonia phage Jace]AWN03650.1 hypothetical protein PBI_JACE_30 [Gordonia phage Jace]